MTESRLNSSLADPSPADKPAAAHAEWDRLLQIVRQLRGPDGCPWDKDQTQTSLVQYVIEEAFELAEALESGQQTEILEELGDYLFQVVLQAQVAQDEKKFEIVDVLRRLNEKMIHRHPHVFGDVGTRDLDEVWLHWDKLKAQESKKKKPLFNYPRQMPALQASHKIGVKTEGYAFDWTQSRDVLEKIKEEVRELEEAFEQKDPHKMQHEIGDVLFSVAQFARHENLEAESSLRQANRRFENRFNKVLELANLDKEDFRGLPAEKKEELWARAKKILRSQE